MSEEAHSISVITTELAREIERLKNENRQQALLIAFLQNKERERDTAKGSDLDRKELQEDIRLLKEQNRQATEKIDFLTEQSQNARNALIQEYHTSAVHFKNILSIVRGTSGDMNCLQEQLETYISCTGYLDDDEESSSSEY